MSVHHLEKAGELPAMDPTKKLVLMAICDDASKDTRVAYPGLDKLTLWSGRSERRVKELVEDLVRDGYLARRRFAYRGKRAEYIVFPTDAELLELDEFDEKLNAARKKPRRRREPVDNSAGKGAARRIPASENGGGIPSNGGDPDRPPPVSTPKNSSTGPVPEVTSDGPVDNSDRTGQASSGVTPRALSRTHGLPLQPADVFASCGHQLPDNLDDAGLQQLADEIIAKASSRVLDPTAYVIRALRIRGLSDDLADKGRWLARAEEIADAQQAARGLRVGSRF